MKRFLASLGLCTFITVAAPALSACGAHAGTGEAGTPLFALSGTVKTSAASEAPAQGLDAALVWAQIDAQGKTTNAPARVGSSVAVEGQFPASFTLDAYAPPPDAVLGPIGPAGASRYGMAVIAAVKAEQLFSQAVDLANLVGGVEDYVVLYLAEDLPSGVGLEGVSVSPTRGFHLLKGVTAPGSFAVALEEVPEGTAVSIVLGDLPFRGSSSGASAVAGGGEADGGVVCPDAAAPCAVGAVASGPSN
jgi:hypothetical protein